MTYGYTLARNWIGLTGLALAMAGCPAGDDSGTGATTFNVPTTSAGSTTDEATTSGGGSTSQSATTAPAESSGGESSGGVVCDPPCEAGQECIGGTCFDMGGDSSSGDPPPPTNSDYGPCDMCAPGESPVMVGMVAGCFCSPGCDGQGSACPAPNEGTGQAMCVLELMMGAGPTNCALICGDTADCPPGATCEDAGGGSVCVHPAP